MFLTKRVNIKLLSLVLTGILIMSGCGSKADGKVSVVGSTSVQPLLQSLADEYSTLAQQKIDIQGVGSTAGIRAIKDGICDIGTTSRELSDEEKTWNLRETVIALDGIAVIVNPKNRIDNLTRDQLSRIFKGEIRNWQELGGENKEILVVNREAGSGTRGAFEELFKLEKKENGKTISLVVENALIAEGNGAVMANVAGKAYSIGYMSIGMIDPKKVKSLKVDGIEPSEQNVKDKKYNFFRPFIILTKPEPRKEAEDFINFILGEEGQSIASKEYIPVK